jgi:hypothetical protein
MPGAGDRAALAQAYRATTYRVYVARRARIDLHPGRRCIALDRLLARIGARHWAFITAWNPRSRSLPGWRNAKRQRDLLARLRTAGLQALPAAGIPATGNWSAEESLFVPGLAPGAARTLARVFGQNAILAGRRGGPARLIWAPGASMT